MRSIVKSAALALALLGTAQAATAITTTAVNLRRSPGGAIITAVPGRTLLTVACKNGWCRTTYQGRGGYIASPYLRPLTKSAPLSGKGVKFYATCAEMRAAGAAPVRVGKPGYRTALDTDGDGWACRFEKR